MATESVPFTKEGFHRLKAELDQLKMVERQKVIDDIAEARAHGDLSENAEYHAAREKQGFIEARISVLEDRLSRGAVITSESQDTSKVGFGAWVTLVEEESGQEKTYRIVGELEADVAAGKISLSSPIARALMGKQIDDLVEVKAPKGSMEYVISELRY